MSEETATSGDTVSVIYTGKLEDGTVFDSNRGGDLFSFQLGSGQVIPGFEKAVEGLKVGKTTEIELPPEDAYGERDEELVIPVKEEIFGDNKPEPGMEVALRGRDGNVFNGRVADKEGDTVKVDLNHPLAGQKLVFEIELVGVENGSS